MRKCMGRREHDPEPKKVKDTCGPQDMWTPTGNKTVWLCSHKMICKACHKVVKDRVWCPDNKDHLEVQPR